MKCYEYSQDGVSLTVSVVFSFFVFFFIKKLGAQKTEIKGGYQFTAQSCLLKYYRMSFVCHSSVVLP